MTFKLAFFTAILGVGLAPCATPPADIQQLQCRPSEPEVVLFGGTNGTTLGDTWVWKGSTWKQKLPANSPSPRSYSAMAYDRARNEVVLFGGNDGSSDLSDTWVWNGENWKQRFPQNSPPARDSFVMAYDGAHQEIVLFGGRGPAGSMGFGDTWTWNGRDWTQKFPTSSPSPRILSTMSYDPSTRQMVLFGGNEFLSHFNDTDTWVWNGENWQLQPSASLPQAQYSFFTSAYDPVVKKILLIGNAYFQGLTPVTYLWNGTSWDLGDNSSGPGGVGLAAYDFSSKRALFEDQSSNTFGWSGSWQQLSPAKEPPARDGFALTSRRKSD